MLRQYLYITLLIGLFSPFCQSEMYSWINESGERIYSDQKPSDDKQAKQLTPNKSVNYYNAAITKKSPITQPRSEKQSIQILDQGTQSKEPSGPTESDCQQIYGLDCNTALNWRKDAIESCGDDPRCEDEDFLARKYQPLTLEQRKKNISRTAARRNRQEREISQFLLHKYTDYCQRQAAQHCTSNHCKTTMLSNCQESRSLSSLLAKYSLSVNERKAIIKKAKQLSALDTQKDIDQLISNIIDLLKLQTMLL